MVKLKRVEQSDVYESINSYIENSDKAVETYEDMINIILSMTKEGYCFIMERDYLRDAMESLTYMYSPEDDINKDRIVIQFADEEDDEDEDEDEDESEVDMLKMMQMMGMNPPCNPNTQEDSNLDDNSDDNKCIKCPVTDEACVNECSENECSIKKEEELVPAEDVN